MQKQRLLIAGGGYAEIPLIKAAKSLGYYVITSGNRPEELGHAYADLYEQADFSDKEQIFKIAKKYNINAICSSCNDFSAISSAYVAEKLNLPGHDSYDITKLIHHKDTFRSFCEQNNLKTPIAKSFSSIENAFEYKKSATFPKIVKPIDLSGGKGISKISTINDWDKAINEAFRISKANKIVVEDYIEGTNHGFSTFIKNGKVVFYFTDDEYYYKNKYLVAGTSSPGTISKNAIQQLVTFTEKSASILQLNDGLFHIQCIIKNDIAYVLEVCRRPPGDLYTQFVEHATGFEYSKTIIQFISGMNMQELTQIDTQGFYARHCIMGSKQGYVSNVLFNNKITENLIEEFRILNPKDFVENYLSQKASILFMSFNSKEDMKKISSDLYNYISFEYA